MPKEKDRHKIPENPVLELTTESFADLNERSEGQLQAWVTKFQQYSRGYYDTNAYAPVLDRIAQTHSTAIRRIGTTMNALIEYCHAEGLLFVVTSTRGRRYFYSPEMLERYGKDDLVGQVLDTEEQLEARRRQQRSDSMKKYHMERKLKPKRKKYVRKARSESDLVD